MTVKKGDAYKYTQERKCNCVFTKAKATKCVHI